MYVQDVSGDTVTTVRGVNGTTAMTHTDGQSIFLQDRPPAVVESTLLVAARSWKRKDSQYGPVADVNSLGAVRVAAGRDPDVEDLLAPFCWLTVARSTVVVP